jgi:HTH-type transcriptional regulator / antitoxin HigA
MPKKTTRSSGKRSSSGRVRGESVGDRYLALIHKFPLRPIRTDEELDDAIATVSTLLDRDDLAADEQDYLDVLGDLVEKYESEHHPMPPVSDAEVLRHLIEARDETQAKVAAGAGIAESTISDVLAGRRGLNRRHITALSRYFAVSPAVFLTAGA